MEGTFDIVLAEESCGDGGLWPLALRILDNHKLTSQHFKWSNVCIYRPIYSVEEEV